MNKNFAARQADAVIPRGVFSNIAEECAGSLERLCAAVDAALPVPARFVRRIPDDVAELSRLLTSASPERGDGYLGDPRLLSAYCRYAVPWNVWRLCRLFLTPEAAALVQRRSVLDLGAGPLTLALALWAAFPLLRGEPVAFYALDHTKKALAAGRGIFSAFAGASSPWKITTRQGRFDDRFNAPPAELVSAIFLLNEVIRRIPQADTEALRAAAASIAERFIRRAAAGGAILIVEPGVPRAAQFLSILRGAFAERGWFAALPCPDPAARCALPGGRRGAKWCHWTLDPGGVPAPLARLSAEAGLAKEKAVLSFLLLTAQKPAPARTGAPLTVRVMSEIFELDDGLCGRYGCSAEGLVLVRGLRRTLRGLPSGSAFSVNPDFSRRDAQSNALIITPPQ